jgi:hypothetical protein
VKAVVAQFILNMEKDQQGTGHSESQSGDVDKGISLVLFHVAEGDLEIITDHHDSPGKSYS